MRSAGAFALGILFSAIAFSQTSDSNHTGVSSSVNMAPSSPQEVPAAAAEASKLYLDKNGNVRSTPPEQPDAVKYASRQLLLVTPEPGGEAVLPMVMTTDGVQRILFVAVSQVSDYLRRGGQPLRLADVLSALGESTEAINKLQAENTRLQIENDRLWKVALKDSPRPASPTVVVQQAPPQGPSPMERYLLLRSLWQPIQVPGYQPIKPLPSVPYRPPINCTTQAVGNTAFTNCN